MTYDAIIIGGSFAGLSAATMLARARRKILIIDSGQPRNRYASHSHGVLAQDGRPGAEILADARSQVASYPTVALVSGEADSLQGEIDDFTVRTTAGTAHKARRVLLASGLEDILPDIPGLKERWGKTVIHCPYCHGYEVGGGDVGVIARGATAAHHAAMVADWGNVRLFTNGLPNPDEEGMALLKRRNVELVCGRIGAIENGTGGTLNVMLDGGGAVAVKALFVMPECRIRSGIPEAIGCAFTETPIGRIIATDAVKTTSVPGIFAAGDIARPFSNITLSSADGVTAGAGVHHSLLFGGH